MAEQDLIQTERAGGIVTITLNNPDKRNALTLKAWTRLGYVLAPLAMDESVRCIVLRGAGDRAFVAGADISEFPEVRANGEQAAKYCNDMSVALDTLTHCPHPTVAMIHGACTGGGLVLACCCDIRMTGRSARFGAPINRLGHPLAYPELEPVQAVVGRAAALDMLLSGRLLDAEEALRLGLASQVFDDAVLEAETLKLVAAIADAAPLSNRLTKKFINRLSRNPAPPSPAEVAEGYAACDSEDYAEGVRAFLAKEKPAFKGR